MKIILIIIFLLQTRFYVMYDPYAFGARPAKRSGLATEATKVVMVVMDTTYSGWYNIDSIQSVNIVIGDSIALGDTLILSIPKEFVTRYVVKRKSK